MVLKLLQRMCGDLLVEKDRHYKGILEEKEIQCSKLSREYTDLVLKEQEASNTRFLTQKEKELDFVTTSKETLLGQQELRIQQLKNYTDHLSTEKDFRLENLQKAMEHQQGFFCAFGLVLIFIIIILMVIVWHLFVRQENEKQSLNLKYESIIKEKSDRISNLEERHEELLLQQKKNETKVRNVQTSAMMAPHHPMMFAALPSVMPTMATSASPTIQTVEE